MIGLFLVLTSTFFKEIGTSIGKTKVAEHKESIYTFGFLSMLGSMLFFLFIAFFIRGAFLFSLESLPTFTIRAILEIAQAHVSILAITVADRSTFGFLRIITIPLLLSVDIVLGYSIGLSQIAGIAIIVFVLIFLLLNHGIRKKGMWLVLFTAVNAVVTISLFKYNITHFNSVEAEQALISGIVLIYFLIMALFVAKENPFRFLRQPVFLLQSVTEGISHVVLSFAYIFAAASVITTAKRALSILWAILSGNLYFREKHIGIKIIALIVIVIGFIFLI